MEHSKAQSAPNRVGDLIALSQAGAAIDCRIAFEVIPVDFTHRNHAFQAYIFLCRYSGQVDGRTFTFRKCYARGCPNNLCPHVSQAVMIANRYLQRDYRRLKEAGLYMENRLFTLEDMMVKYDDANKEYGAVMTIHDYINMAREGNAVSIEINPELVPAVEHFAGHRIAQVFLMADFVVSSLGQSSRIERCLACYPAEKEREEKNQAVTTANSRLEILYGQFDEAAVRYNKNFFK
jgi:hypothetical protein